MARVISFLGAAAGRMTKVKIRMSKENLNFKRRNGKT